MLRVMLIVVSTFVQCGVHFWPFLYGSYFVYCKYYLCS